jgi:hypothetical protein
MRNMMSSLFGLLALLVLPSCITSSQPEAEPGQFEGNVFVMWVDEGGQSGNGRFLFVPDPRRPLTFRRPLGREPGATIRPHMMYTDGGSIPRAAQLFNGLSPWGYAPAYMIHDWLFVARHCLVDGDLDPRYVAMSSVSFADSRDILDEAIRALVAERRVASNDVAAAAISAGVSSPVARRLWERRGACTSEKVRPEHLAAAEAAVPGSAGPLARGTLPSDVGVRAFIIDTVSF